MYLRNAGLYILLHAKAQPIRPTLSSLPPREPQVSWNIFVIETKSNSFKCAGIGCVILFVANFTTFFQ